MGTRDDDGYVDFVMSAQDRLRRTAYLMTGDWVLAGDITQEALLKVYLAWPRLAKGGGMPTYARRAVVTQVIDHRRRVARRPAVIGELPDHGVDDEGTTRFDDREAIISALRLIPERQRACLVLRYFEELSVAESAEILNCSIGTVKSQTSHGLASLKKHLERLGMTSPVLAGEA